MRKIENDEQYQNSQKWLLEKAKELDHPLMEEGPVKAQLMAKYDFVLDRVLEYQQDKLYQNFPYMRRIDEAAGLIEKEELPAPIPEQQPKPQVNLSSWLDD